MSKTLKLFLLIAACLAALIWCTGGTGLRMEQQNKLHVVKAGQTIWGIATEYMPQQNKTWDIRELIYDIGKANKLHNYQIQPGQQLVIPLMVEIKENEI